MAKKSEQRIKIGLVCTVCKAKNYITTKNKLNTPDKMTPRKYCRHCKKITEHKETEKLK